jgi:hypothetical protein
MPPRPAQKSSNVTSRVGAGDICSDPIEIRSLNIARIVLALIDPNKIARGDMRLTSSAAVTRPIHDMGAPSAIANKVMRA